MSATTNTIVGARLSTMPTEPRLPTIERMAAQLCDQADCEGWPGRRLLRCSSNMSSPSARRDASIGIEPSPA